MKTVEELLESLKQALVEKKYSELASISNELAQLENGSDVVITQLIEALDTPDVAFEVSVAIALHNMGEKAKIVLLQNLKDGSPQHRSNAAKALMRMIPIPPEAIQPFVQQILRDPEPEVRERSHLVLQSCPDSVKAQIAALFAESFNENNPEVNTRATTAFTYVDKNGIEPLNKIFVANPNNPRVKSLVLTALNNIKNHSPQAHISIQPYYELAKDPDNNIRFQFLSLLSKVDPTNELLYNFIKDPDEKIRQEAIRIYNKNVGFSEQKLTWILEQIEEMDIFAEHSSQATPEEKNKMSEQFDKLDKVIRRLVLPGPVPEQAVELFIDLFFKKAENSGGYYFVIMGLETLGPAASKLIPHLVTTLSNPQATKHSRYLAIKLLGAVGKDDKNIANILLKVFSNPDEDLPSRRIAVESLSKLEPALAGEVVDILKESLAQAEPELGIDIAHTLGKLEPTYTPALDYLLAIVTAKNSDFKLIENAVSSLSPFKGVGRVAGPASIELFRYGEAALPAVVKLFTTLQSQSTPLTETQISELVEKLQREIVESQTN